MYEENKKNKLRERRREQVDKVKELIKRADLLLRMAFLSFLLVIAVFFCVLRLIKIQLIDGEMYVEKNTPKNTIKVPVAAARGQIFDVDGKLLNTNSISYKIRIEYAFFPTDDEERARVISKIIEILNDAGEQWNDDTPITKYNKNWDYSFEAGISDEKLDRFKKNLDLNPDATIENCINALYENYKIPDDFSEEVKREVAGIRYQMLLKNFSKINHFYLADDVSEATVSKIKELSSYLPGVDIEESIKRVYLDGEVLPHSRGTIGSINETEYDELKDEGYGLNDIIGKFGVEYAYEDILRGQNGTKEVSRAEDGSFISEEMLTETTAGYSVRLTIENHFQSEVQRILEDGITKWLHYTDQTTPLKNYQRGLNTEGGAIVVLNAKTGAVLAMASYPWYDINEYITDYSDVLNAELTPLLSRATNGIYRPGSTFKTITGTAGLGEGVISPSSIVTCNRIYRYFEDYQPKCTGTHGSIGVATALRHSCNIFFYDVGRRVGLNTFAEYAKHFGLGVDTGFDLPAATGRVTTVEYINDNRELPWSEGDTIQAAIGQSETYVTPLALAVQAMTLANRGTRLRPYIVDSVWDYDGENMISKTMPEVVDQLDLPDYIWSTIEDGMKQVTSAATWPKNGSGAMQSIYRGLDEVPATKTGTPQVTETIFNSTIVGYYPPSDPEIAFSVVLENSDWSRYFIRNIIDAYYYDNYEPDLNASGTIILSPWKEWFGSRETETPQN